MNYRHLFNDSVGSSSYLDGPRIHGPGPGGASLDGPGAVAYGQSIDPGGTLDKYTSAQEATYEAQRRQGAR